ncbi:hypothetical protein ACRE_072660 [Hapsidospora chrysogenum ATCC 11550]|uniref:GST N-terminal domain-containing protein n=1 Tax=Hapsidospora chrysogenum (strain ATCC 11550 / CBS 779.69 / DSM 880 / IAM 14645 / JCM 23072 / IMI 49137) TaxID=857340 RepID=A0A086SY44_HAPC1|nr:hypothetical protein ACRE_072660 [Hapsidospora chrysogenum ATCC 11550]
MTYTLFIANKRYSSWSMRPWVLLKALDIPFEEKMNLFGAGYRQPQFQAFSPTGKVPCLHDSSVNVDNGGEGGQLVVWDSLAIAEYLADKGHEGVWPAAAGRDKGLAARTFARCAAAEMHSGFTSIRDECSLNVGLRIDMGGSLSEGLQRDLARLDALFKEGLERFGGPWLAGPNFTAVDAFFAPVASRCKTYGLALEGPAAEYLDRLFEHPAVQAWVQDGIKETAREPDHEEDCVRGRTILEDLCK